MPQMDACVDAAIVYVWHESMTAIDSLTKAVQLRQSRQQISDLSIRGTEGQAHTERVRQQVVAVGHTADERYAESTKRQDALADIVEQLTKMVARLMPPDGDDAAMGDGGGPAAGGSADPPQARARPNPATASGVDPTILRVNAQVAVSRSQVHAVLLAFARAHTTVPGDAIKVIGAEAGRCFVVRVAGEEVLAAQRLGQLFLKLRNGAVVGVTWRSHCLRAARRGFASAATSPAHRWLQR